MNKDQITAILSEAIRSKRKAQGFSQEDFARHIDMGRRYYGAIERGEHNISVYQLMKICDGLNIKAGTLLLEVQREIQE